MVKHKLFRVIGIVTVTLIALIIITPIILTIFQSLENPSGYIDFFLWQPKYLRALINSLLMATIGSGGCVVISIGAAYVFSKIKFYGRNFLFFIYIIVMMIPFQVTMLPLYITMRNTNLYDSIWAIILPNMFSAFGAFFLTQLIKTIPNETLESARLETDSTFIILLQIVIPQIKSGLLCLFSLLFTDIWNMISEPMTLMESIERLPLSALIVGDVSPAGIAAIIVSIVPSILLYSFFQEEIITGLSYYKLK